MSKFVDIVKRLWHARRRLWNSRDLLQYMVFVAIAGIFWCFMTFNQTSQQEVTVKLRLVGKPKSITFIDDLPATVTVTVKDRGTTFLKLLFRATPEIALNFNDYYDERTGLFRVNYSALNSQLRKLFRRDASIGKISPENIECRTTDRPAKRVPVDYFDNLNVSPDKRYVMYGDIECAPDSVDIYGDIITLAGISEVKIAALRETNVDHTLERMVRLQAIDGVRIKPATVTLTIPVEPLIQKRQAVPVQVRNLPDGVNVIVFPGTVDATFLLPQSLYKKPVDSFVAVVDYNAINTDSKKVAVTVGEVPAVYEGVKLSTDSVEYIIER